MRDTLPFIVKFSPPDILIGILGVWPLVVLEPESIPVNIPLKGRQSRHRMLGLMHFIRVIVKLNGNAKPGECGSHLKVGRQRRRRPV
jgi:hypothetical protein